MLGEVGFVVVTLLVLVLVGKLSHRTGLPDAALLTIVGLAYGFLPGPNVRLDPEIVLDVVLPPLLYHAALGSSLHVIALRPAEHTRIRAFGQLRSGRGLSRA